MKKAQKNHHFLSQRLNLKLILNIWTFVTICLFTLDFFSGNTFDSSAGIVGVIYMALLSIYAGQKELIRWQTDFSSRFIGESFIGIWTALMVIFALTAPFSNGMFKLPEEFAVVYTTVVGIYAITQYSKNLNQKRR